MTSRSRTTLPVLFASWWGSGTWPRPIIYRLVTWVALLAAAVMAADPPAAAVVAGVGLVCAALRAMSMTSMAAMAVWERLDAVPGAGPAGVIVTSGAVLSFLGVHVSLLRVVFALVFVSVVVAWERWLHTRLQRPHIEVGEVWWAAVRFDGADEDGRREKVRPVVVVRDAGTGLEVLYGTSRGDRYDRRSGWMRITGGWHRDPTWVDTTRRVRIGYRALERRGGVVDGRQLDKVLHAARRSARTVQRR